MPIHQKKCIGIIKKANEVFIYMKQILKHKSTLFVKFFVFERMEHSTAWYFIKRHKVFFFGNSGKFFIKNIDKVLKIFNNFIIFNHIL